MAREIAILSMEEEDGEVELKGKALKRAAKASQEDPTVVLAKAVAEASERGAATKALQEKQAALQADDLELKREIFKIDQEDRKRRYELENARLAMEERRGRVQEQEVLFARYVKVKALAKEDPNMEATADELLIAHV